MNERKETNLEELLNKLVFPVHFYLKYNGFLGILSLRNDEFFFASKSTNTGNYVEYFKNIFYQKFNNKQMQAIKDIMIENNITIVFEVIDPVNDPHIIEYNEANIVLLDMIYNYTHYSKIPYEKLKTFATIYDIDVKKCVYVVDNVREFKDIYENTKSSNYQYNGKYVEGFVIEDNIGFMVKTKTHYYDTWKHIRTKMENALKTGNYKSKWNNKLEEAFMYYLKAKYENKDFDIQQITMIDERNAFERTNIKC